MLLQPYKLREIIEEAQFADELHELEPNHIRADEFIDGAKFVLSRSPEYGDQVSRHVWFLPMWSMAAGYSLNLYYTFDAERVFFLSITKAAGEPAEE